MSMISSTSPARLGDARVQPPPPTGHTVNSGGAKIGNKRRNG